MKIIVAPDSFKGSITAIELCRVISSAIHAVDPQAEVVEIPLSDGGEGMVECLVHATNGHIITSEATNPAGERIEAAYGILGDGKTAVIETAAASGLTLIPEHERNPLTASSYGTGQLIADALQRGYRQLLIGLGGSAVNDGGMGLLRALGVEFYDEQRQPLPEGGGSLAQLAYIDESMLNRSVHEANFMIACDVDHRLYGPEGASVVFGPQKGATEQMVRQLDDGLQHYADIVWRQKGVRMLDIVGGGAAGGLGAALAVYANGTIQAGITTILEAIDWERRITGAQLIITGEGKLDVQTLSGKTIHGVCASANRRNIPVIALAGSIQLTSDELQQLGVTAAFSIVPGPISLPEAMERATEWTKFTTEQIYRLISRFSRNNRN